MVAVMVAGLVAGASLPGRTAADRVHQAGVGPGARLFITKCFPAHGKLSQQDFLQLRDAGFTVVVDNWVEDLPAYVARAATAGLDAMTWGHGLAAAPNDRNRWLGRSGKPLQYARPGSAYAWREIGDQLVAEAELSLAHPNFRGAILDFEVYDKNKSDTAGFSESYDETTFRGFFASQGLTAPQPLPAADQRRRTISDRKVEALYTTYNQALVLKQVRRMRDRLDAVNPRFQVGVYGWGCLQMATLRGVATESAPALFINAETYGRTSWTRADGYQADFPDRLGLKQNLIGNYRRAMTGRRADFPLIVLAGHYPQAAGPSDGTQYRFTARDSFNSVAAADGYWIWTDWGAPPGFGGSRQDWVDAMMAYWADANGALDRGDWTWVNRQTIQAPNPESTVPAHIVTVRDLSRGGEIVVWDPLTGVQNSSFGADPEDPNVAVACGDLLENVPGNEVITLTASGSLRLYNPATRQIVGGFQAERFGEQTADRIRVADGAIYVGRRGRSAAYEYDGAGNQLSAPDFPAPRGLLGDDAPALRLVRLVGHEVWVFHPDTMEAPEEVIRVGHGLRAIAIADVDAIVGNELVTLNAGLVRYWHYPSGAPLLRFGVGHDSVDMAAGHLLLTAPE